MWNERPPFSTILKKPSSLVAFACSVGVQRIALCSLTFLASTTFLGRPLTATTAAIPCAVVGLKDGIVVEAVTKASEGERAGLAEGDVILSWSRGDIAGKLNSPFDLSAVDIEQAPQGPVTLHGESGQTWVIGPGKWGIQARPNLTGILLALYLQGRELANEGKFEEATVQWQHVADNIGSSDCSWLASWLLLHAAETLDQKRQRDKADVVYRAAVERSGVVKGRVAILLLLAWAESFRFRGDTTNAATYYQRALDGARKLEGGNRLVDKSITGLGDVDLDRGNLDKAETYYRDALAMRQKVAPGSLDVAQSDNDLGTVALDRGDFDTAEENYRAALQIREKMEPGSLDVSSTLADLGIVAWQRGDLDKATEYYRQVFEIDNKVAPDSPELARHLGNFGVIAYKRGDLDKASAAYLQSLAIGNKLGLDPLDAAANLNNLGNDEYERGNLDKAEIYHRQALVIRKQLAPQSIDVAASLFNLGDVVEARGDLGGAREYYLEALEILNRISPNSLDVAGALTNLGTVEFDRGNLVAAETYHRQALEIRQKLAPGSLDVAESLSSLGKVARAGGDSAKAQDLFHQALIIDEKFAPDSLRVAESLNNLGDLARDQHQLTEASEYYTQAIEIRKKLASTSTAYAESLAGLAETRKEQQKVAEAMQLYSQAIDVLETQLAHLGGSSDIRASFRAKHADYYSDYADLLISQNQTDLAFQIVERSRAQTLLETLAEAHLDIRRGADTALLERERTLREMLTAKSDRKIKLLEGKHTPEQVAAINKEINDAIEQYREVEGQIRVTSPRYASLMQPQPLTAREVQRELLDPNTILLEYVLGTERSHVFVLTFTSLNVYELPKKSEIERGARQVYDLVTTRNQSIAGENDLQRKARLAKRDADYQNASKILSRMLLSPIAAQLESKRLLIVADGPLQYIPFAALPVPLENASRPPIALVDEHEIVNLPSASVLAMLRQQAIGHSVTLGDVAILADPVFDKHDPRVARAAQTRVAKLSATDTTTTPSAAFQLTRSLDDTGFSTQVTGFVLPRLSFSREEAKAIMATVNSGRGIEVLDFAANRDKALSGDLSRYRIVHFATHGLLDTEHPQLSGLVLSLVDAEGKPKNGFLDLEDVYNLILNADLVVLSACETGLGKQINGEGLVGLTRGFMYAGATRVVASLWNVDDVATADLMAIFYRGMLKEGLRPAAALRRAQIEMEGQKRWTDPYYWAAFTIQGDWK